MYLPCILQTKKRYVGMAYESLDQKEPEFDAKGIETVRRDGCPAVAKVNKILINALCCTLIVIILSDFGEISKAVIQFQGHVTGKILCPASVQ